MKQVTIMDKKGDSLCYHVEDDKLDAFILNIPSLGFGKAAYDEVIKNPDKTESTINHPAEFLVEIVDVTLDIYTNTLRAQRLAEGAKARQACQVVLDFISGVNVERQLTLPQIQQMLSSLSSVHSALVNNMPKTAKDLIFSMTPDGVLITDDLKTEILALLSSCGY